MSRTTRITGPDGRVTTIKQTSSCGCLTVLAAVVVIFGPAAWFGPVGAVLAYTFLGLLVVGALAYQISQARRRPVVSAPTPPPAPPPAAP
ncbi:MAG: hypothetical protein WB808_03405 [Candidatus Dormiibacterota bacterium]